ncbi:carboxypeptidase regulatory-like domain-containing protein [Methanocella sp. MCL-LM]|uniref:carboxypeptidase regulatory-like domain-containing protein n=1 Tax=Methanocella sp. MCL-LM TaxID=3412035 RepID=UPI003C74642B
MKLSSSILLIPILLSLFFVTTPTSVLADSPITVLVKDKNGAVSGALISVQVNGATYSTQTDLNGIGNFSLPPGQYYFTAAKTGYASGSGTATIGDDSTVTITLTNLYSLSGTVIDSATGLPKKDAAVTITNKETEKSYIGGTNDNGVFSIPVSNGYYSVTVRAPFYQQTVMDDKGAGYHVLDSSLYIGYLPIATDNNITSLNGVKLTSDYPGKVVKVNQSATFDVTLTNNGIVDKSYAVSVKDAPAGWNVQLLSGSDVISRVFVEKGSSKTFQVKTTPLSTGNNVIIIIAGSESDVGQVQLYVDSTTDTDYKLEFSMPENLSLAAGTSKNVDVYVKNNGSGKLSSVRIDIGSDDVPDSLNAEVVTREATELAPGESKRFVIKITAKADASEGTERLYMRAVSNEAKTEQKYVEASVSRSNSWLGIGIGIALLAILAFGFIVWKYGRR